MAPAAPGHTLHPMTQAQIAKVQAAEAKRLAVKFDTAAAIRKLLDEARKAWGKGWEEEDVEAAILELVTADEPE